MHAAELKAIEDQENAKQRFREWVKTKVPDAVHMNICSGAQVMPPASLIPRERPLLVMHNLGFLEGFWQPVWICMSKGPRFVGWCFGAGSFTCL